MLNTDDLILREETYTGLTTKGSELTNQELDNNFINIRKDIVNLSTAPNLPNYNPITIYSQFNVVTYNDKIYRFISVTPQDGIEPSSDPLVWEEINLNELAHQQNSDIKLAEGTSDEVTANEIRNFIDAGVGTSIYSADGIINSNRTVDVDGKDITFSNGRVYLFSSNVAAPGALGSFNIDGNGTSSEIIELITSDLGTIRKSYANKEQEFHGNVNMISSSKVYFDSNTNTFIRKSSGSNGVEISGNGGSWIAGWNDAELRSFGNFGADSVAVHNTQTTSYFTQLNGSYAWGFGKNVNDGSIKGNIGGSFVNTEILKIHQSDGEIEFLVAKLKSVLQVGNAGLTSGQWYQDTSANVLANGDKVIAIKQ